LKSGFGFDKLRPFSTPMRHIYQILYAVLTFILI